MSRPEDGARQLQTPPPAQPSDVPDNYAINSTTATSASAASTAIWSRFHDRVHRPISARDGAELGAMLL